LRAAGETETTQENIKNRLHLDGDPGFQFVTEEETVAVIFFIYLFSSAVAIFLSVPFICYLEFFFFQGYLLLH
jgi:hypothetical protein